MPYYRVILLLFYFVSISSAISQEHLYSISLSGSYTTSSKLFFNPNASNDILRAQNYSFGRVVSFGIDIRRSFEDSGVQVGLSIERLFQTEVVSQPITASGVLRANDGYLVVPVELTGYFIIPFSSETVQMYMGGGGGAYPGVRHYEIGSVSAEVVDRSTGYGIHVLTGLQINLANAIAVRAEVKFRDVQFTSTNKFNLPVGFSNGQPITLNTRQFDSRISIDGMVMTVGLAYLFR